MTDTPSIQSPDDRRLALELWVKRLKAAGKITSRSNWCKEAGVSEGGVRDFVNGRNDSLNELTYQKLAVFAGVEPLSLRQPPQIDEDIAQTDAGADARKLLKLRFIEALDKLTPDELAMELRTLEMRYGDVPPSKPQDD